MPLTITTVLTFIPTQVWKFLKKLTKKNAINVVDGPFRISTIYTPLIIAVFLCLSFGNQFLRNIDIDCTAAVRDPWTSGTKGYDSGGYSDSTSSTSELNDYCFNYGTFLVVKGLLPENRHHLAYPGNIRYSRGHDKIIKQSYYKFIWLIWAALFIVSYLPHFLWKGHSEKKIKDLVHVTADVNTTKDDTRAYYFLETVGFNQNYSYYFLCCKVLATTSPVLQGFLTSLSVGQLFLYYGFEVVLHGFSDGDPWPNPMDVLFPKIAKCEWARYGYNGDLEYKSAQCQLVMNNITQWTFFIYWWWLVIVFVVNVISLVWALLWKCTPFYKFGIRKLVLAACADELKIIRSNCREIPTIVVDLSFADLVVMEFISKNLEDYEYRQFIRRLALIENNVLCLQGNTQDLNNSPEWTELPHCTTTQERSPLDRTEIGFKKSILHHSLTATLAANEFEIPVPTSEQCSLTLPSQDLYHDRKNKTEKMSLNEQVPSKESPAKHSRSCNSRQDLAQQSTNSKNPEIRTTKMQHVDDEIWG